MEAGVSWNSSLTHEAAGRKRSCKCVEIQLGVLYNNDFAVQDAARRQLRFWRVEQFCKIAVQRLLITALNRDLVAVSEYGRPEPVLFRLEKPVCSLRQFANSLGEHGQYRRIHWKLHNYPYTTRAQAECCGSAAIDGRSPRQLAVAITTIKVSI